MAQHKQGKQKLSATRPVLSRKQVVKYSSTGNYDAKLDLCDAAVCEAIAVSQATAQRKPNIHLSYSSYIFTKMCGHGSAIMRAVPRTRWVQCNYERWDFTDVAGHTRSVLEGLLVLLYLIRPASNEAEIKARINCMHLNDCTSRLKMFRRFGDEKQIAGFEKQQAELRDRIINNSYFKTLSQDDQKKVLSGERQMLWSRDEAIKNAGFETKFFNGLWVNLSQYTHILTFAFYRLEANGRGTGIENETDRGQIAFALDLTAAALIQATDAMVDAFPDAQNVRKGVRSKFSPGPVENMPEVPDGTLQKAILASLKKV